MLRRLHPAIAAAVATVPWADTTTTVRDIVRWRAALPAAVGCKAPDNWRHGAIYDAHIAHLPSTLRVLDVSYCQRLTNDVNFTHLSVLESLDCTGTFVEIVCAARMPPSLRELRMKYCKLRTAADFSHLRALRVLDCSGMGIHNTLGAATITSLPPSLEVLDIGHMGTWPAGGSLAHLPHLRVLGVAGTCIDAAALATFPPLIHSLDLADCELPDTASFERFHGLRTLTASSSNIGDAVLTTLPPSLVSLDLQYAGVKNGRLTPAAVFPHLPALRMLNVNHTAIGDAAVASMPPSLEELRMVDCANVTRSANLGHLTALQVLHSSGTDISPAAIASCRACGCAAPADGVVVNASGVGGAASVVLLPDGRLVSCTRSGRVALWAAVHGGARLAGTQIEGRMDSCHLAILPDGHRVAIAVRDSILASNRIVVWDTRGVLQAARGAIDFRDELATSALTALPNGHLAVGCAPNGALRIVDVDAGAVRATMTGHSNTVAALAALSRGRLASGSHDKTVRVWDVDARVCVATLAGHSGGVLSLVALPDGRLASGSSDGTVRLWDVGRRTCVGVLQGLTRALLIVLPGSDRLASVSCDDVLQVWDLDTHDATGGAPRLSVELAGAGAEALVALPDGRLATGGGQGVRLWRVPLGLGAAQAPRLA